MKSLMVLYVMLMLWDMNKPPLHTEEFYIFQGKSFEKKTNTNLQYKYFFSIWNYLVCYAMVCKYKYVYEWYTNNMQWDSNASVWYFNTIEWNSNAMVWDVNDMLWYGVGCKTYGWKDCLIS